MNNLNITKIRIRKIRKLRNITQQELAESIGVSKSTISKYESGNITNIKIDTLNKIADVLGVSIAYLLDVDLPAYYIENEEDIKIHRKIGKEVRGYIENYENLDEKGKTMLRENIDVLLKYA